MAMKNILGMSALSGGAIRRATGAGFVITSGLVVMRLSAFIVSVLVARFAGVETLGEFTLFVTVFILASEIPHAFDTAYLRATGKLKGQEEQHVYENMNFVSKLVLFIVFGLVFYSLKDLIALLLGKPASGEIVAWGVVCGGMNSLYMLLPARAQQRKNHFHVALLKPVFNLLVLVMAVAMVAIGVGYTITSLSVVYAITGVLLAVLAFFVVWDHSVYRLEYIEKFRAYLWVALALLASTALTLIGNRLDVFMLGYYLEFEELGMYGVALRISIVVSVLTGAMATIMVPKAAAASADTEKFKKYLALGAFYCAIQIVSAVILVMLIDPLITLLFGSEYLAASIPAAILIVQVLASSIGVPFQALLQCGDKPSIMIYVSLIRVVISVPLLLFMIPRYSVNGAAIAITLTTTLMTAVMIWLAVKDRPIAIVQR